MRVVIQEYRDNALVPVVTDRADAIPLEEAFPEDGERREVETALFYGGGWTLWGGGAAPLFRITACR